MGLNLLMSSYRFRKPVPEVLRSVLPVVFVLSAGVLLINIRASANDNSSTVVQ